MKLRKAALSDLETLIQLRLDYLNADQGPLTAEVQTAIRAQLTQYIPEHLDHDFIVILAETDHQVASTAFLTITEKPANPSFLTGKTGTLLNVYTYPAYRRKGIATKVLERVLNEAQNLNVSRIDLLATKNAIDLYRKFGFVTPNHTYTAMQYHLK